MLKSRYSLSGVCVSVGLVVHPMITIILLHVSPLIRPLLYIIIYTLVRPLWYILKYLITICS